jgi:hypothetical protein
VKTPATSTLSQTPSGEQSLASLNQAVDHALAEAKAVDKTVDYAVPALIVGTGSVT